MHCPLCGAGLAKNLLLPSLSIVACPNESCVYPFNLSVEELQRQMLIVKVSEAEIMGQMREKLELADIDAKVSEFMVREDHEVMHNE